MGRIIVGYDGSEDAVAALEYAVAEALARQSSLALVYAVDDTVLNSVWGVVFDPDEIKSDAAAMMGEAVAQAAKLGMPAEKVRAEVVLGDPAAALSKLSPRADLVVLGRCSVGKGVSEFVGSTAVGVAGASECPVVVVSANNHRPEIPFGRVGVGVHIAAKGRVGLPVALAEARRRGAAVSVISVVKATQSRWRAASLTDEQQQQAMDVTRIRLRSLLDQSAPGDVPVDLDVVYGSPLDVLVERSKSLDVIVVEVQNSSFPGVSVGGVARGVMAHGHCPVLVARKVDKPSGSRR